MWHSIQKDNHYSLSLAFIGQKLIPSRSGGVEVVVEELATRMAQLGYQVTCYNRSGHHISGKEFDIQKCTFYKGVALKYVFTIEKKGLAAVTSSLCASICAALGPYDIVHFHAEGPCAMMWIPKLFGKKCIATIHGLDWDREKWKHGFASKFIKFGEKTAVKYADEIIVLSKGVQDYFMNTYHRQTTFIPNGVNRPQRRAPEKIKSTYGLEDSDYILFLARLVPEKGLRYLIKAFSGVHTDKKLVIAGGASDSAEFIAECKELAKNDSRVLFTGFVQGQLLEELYSNAYLYVLPSDLEGMPLSLLEALSYGNCCLVSDIPECTDIAPERLITFQKSNIDDLRRKLQYLCDHKDIVQHYRQDNADYICQKYDWDSVVQKTLDLYQKACDSKKR